jgi:hypothetical protein
MDKPDLRVHDLTVGTRPTFDPKAGNGTAKTLTFSVGTHGPFTFTYAAGQGDAAQMKADIAAQVAELESLNSITG